MELLSTVTNIGDNFLSGCTFLGSLDSIVLSSLSVECERFLNKCKSLTTFDLSRLGGVTSVGNHFMSKCCSLVSLGTGVVRFSRLGDNFLSNCTSLTSLDALDLSRVTTIGEAFLSGCTSLHFFFFNFQRFRAHRLETRGAWFSFSVHVIGFIHFSRLPFSVHFLDFGRHIGTHRTNVYCSRFHV
eukprot:PhF_6_TR3003/c1_g2_i1/m.4506